MEKIIAHIDLNAFFAAAEVIRNPALKDKPLIIGSSGRAGIVSTCSYEARKYGIHSGMPTFKAEKLCKSLIIVKPDFDYYHALSRQFFSIVKAATPIIEVASIDECYADFTEAVSGVKDLVSYFQHLQNTLFEKTKLTASIGVSSTKWVAKMSSDLKKPMGLTFCLKKDIPNVLYPLPIESFWGIGKKTSPILREMGIKTIGELAEKANEEDPALMKALGKFFYTVKDWVNGEGSDEIDTEPFDPKSVGASTTLPFDTSSYSIVEPHLKRLCLDVAERMKEAKKIGSTVTLTVKDTIGSFHLHSKSKTLPEPIWEEKDIFANAKRLYIDNYADKIEIRLIGVSVSKLVEKGHQTVQMTFWNYEEYEKMDQTKLLINEMNRKLHKPLLTRASNAKKEKRK